MAPKREEEILTQPSKQNYITHVAYVLDASSSMEGREEALIKAVDGQTKFLAQLSQDQDHETRVTVYVFADPDNIQCVIFDKDVLRLPSIRDLYKVYGNTALMDATALAIEDLRLTAQKYGNHAFLLFAFTDGQENQSRQHSAYSLNQLVSQLGPNWTVAALVPDINAKLLAKRYGFPDGNISIWDTTSRTGVEEASHEMRAALSAYMTGRTSGVSGTRSLFSTDPAAVNAVTIAAAGLQPLAKDKYVLVPVTAPKRARNEGVENKDKHLVWEISEFVKKANGVFRVGQAYYELSKKERIQGNKGLAIFEINTGKVFIGDQVRGIIGLPDGDKTVAPDFNPEYKIFVQSSSTNRHLVPGTKVLILK